MPTIPPFSPSSSFLVISRRYHIAPDSRGHQTPSSNSRTTPRLQPKSNPSASLSHGVDPLSTSHPSTFNIATKIVIKWSPDGTILAASCFNRGSAHVFPIWTGSQGGGIVQPSDMSNEPGSAPHQPSLSSSCLSSSQSKSVQLARRHRTVPYSPDSIPLWDSSEGEHRALHDFV
jgi:hypothetical protein